MENVNFHKKKAFCFLLRAKITQYEAIADNVPKLGGVAEIGNEDFNLADTKQKPIIKE